MSFPHTPLEIPSYAVGGKLIRRVRQDAVSLLFLFFSPFRYLPYGGFHVTAQLLR